jgi:hypothetical protein
VEGKLEQTHSDLVEIAKRNGDFKKNYGILIGAFLYLRIAQCDARSATLLDRLDHGVAFSRAFLGW